jgi:hypothetical protein
MQVRACCRWQPDGSQHPETESPVSRKWRLITLCTYLTAKSCSLGFTLPELASLGAARPPVAAGGFVFPGRCTAPMAITGRLRGGVLDPPLDHPVGVGRRALPRWCGWAGHLGADGHLFLHGTGQTLRRVGGRLLVWSFGSARSVTTLPRGVVEIIGVCGDSPIITPPADARQTDDLFVSGLSA